MKIYIAFLSAFLLFAGGSVFACDNGKSPSKILFVDSAADGVENKDLQGTKVCINLRQDDAMLDRKPIGAKDASNYWPITINLDKQESVQRIYWPDRTDILARFSGKETTYGDGASAACALVGELGLYKATKLFLSFDNVDAGLLKDLYVDAQGFELVPANHPEIGCVNIDKRVKPAAADKLGFKVAKGVKDGSLTIAARGAPKVSVKFDDLIKAAEDWKVRKSNSQSNVRANSNSLTGIGAFATESFVSGSQIKVGDGYISVSYETDK